MYQTSSELASFCKRYNKNILVCSFGSQLPFTGKTRMLSFTRLCRDTIQVRWKTFTLMYDKFTQDNMYQILLESTRFFNKICQKTFRYVLSVHSVELVNFHGIYACKTGSILLEHRVEAVSIENSLFSSSSPQQERSFSHLLQARD